MRDDDRVIPFRRRESADSPPLRAWHDSDEGWSGRTVQLCTGPHRALEDYGQARLRILHPFWASESEEAEYLYAIEETRGMLPTERMASIAKKMGRSLKRMPWPRQTRRERDATLMKLRGQAKEEVGEEWWNK